MEEPPANDAAPRVLHIVEASFAGVGRHVLDLAKEQADQGADVHVAFSPVRESASFAAERAASSDLTFHEVPMTRSVGLADVAAFRAMAGLRRRLQPDVIHGHSTKGGLMARLVPRGNAVVLYTPNAVYSMNPTLGPAARRVVGNLERLLSFRTSTIIAVSPEERDHLREIGVADDRCVVIPNGIRPYDQPKPASVRAELGLPDDAFVFGFVGRLDDQKSPGALVAAFDAIAGELPHAHLAIIGDGPLAEQLETEVGQADHTERMHLLGEQPGRWAMSAFDAFVLPSLYEGFPYVLIEATSAGLPVVTTEGACASQLISAGVDARIVPSGDVAALSRAMIATEADPATDSTDAATARQAIGASFSVRNMAAEVATIIAELDATPKSSASVGQPSVGGE